MRKLILFLFSLIFLASAVEGASYSAYYYFNSYSAGEAWANSPENMVDGVETNYASTTTSNDVQLLNAKKIHTGFILVQFTSLEEFPRFPQKVSWGINTGETDKNL